MGAEPIALLAALILPAEITDDELAALAAAGGDAAASRNAAELRGVLALATSAPAAVNDEQAIPAAVGA
jgi:hypothetical protein